MGAVDRVAGLEGDDPLPAAVGELLARLLRREVAAHERLLVIGHVVGLDLAGDAAAALLLGGGDAGVGVVGRPVDVLALLLDVALEDLGDADPAELLAVVGAELDDVALADVEVGGEHDRDRPDLLAVGEGHVLDDRLPVLGALEALQRREAAVGEQLEVGGLAGGKGQGLVAHVLRGLLFGRGSGSDLWLRCGRESYRSSADPVSRAGRTRSCGRRPSGPSGHRRRRPAAACNGCSRSTG